MDLKTFPRWRKHERMRARVEIARKKHHLEPSESSTVKSTVESTATGSIGTIAFPLDLESELDSSDDGEEILEASAMPNLREWINSKLDRDTKKQLSVPLTRVCIELSLKVKEAVEIAAEVVGRTEHTVREWRQDYLKNDGEFSEYLRGKHSRLSIVDDESARKRAVRHVRENACKKGQPNLTVCMFCKWVNFELLPSTQVSRDRSPLKQRAFDFMSLDSSLSTTPRVSTSMATNAQMLSSTGRSS